MPLYEYSCSQCESDFELLVGFDEEPECPECGNPKIEKQMSVPAAHTSGGSSQLPMMCNSAPKNETCGLPQCGMGGCQMR